MYTGVKQYLFLVVDQESKGILTSCSSPTIANSVSKGIINSSPMTVHFLHLGTGHPINNYRNTIENNYKLVSNNPSMGSEVNVSEYVKKTISGKLYDLEEFFPDQQFLEKRNLANTRCRSISELETFCERYLSRIKNYAGDDILFLALEKDIEYYNLTGKYSNGIIEWAEINNVSLDAALQELKMLLDTAKITAVRIHAIWNKYVNYINSLSEYDPDLGIKIQAELRFGEI